MIHSILNILVFVAIILLTQIARKLDRRMSKLEAWIKEHKDMIPYNRIADEL